MSCMFISVDTRSARGLFPNIQTSPNCLEQLVASLSRHQSTDCDQHRHIQVPLTLRYTLIGEHFSSSANMISLICLRETKRRRRSQIFTNHLKKCSTMIYLLYMYTVFRTHAHAQTKEENVDKREQ